VLDCNSSDWFHLFLVATALRSWIYNHHQLPETATHLPAKTLEFIRRVVLTTCVTHQIEESVFDEVVYALNAGGYVVHSDHDKRGATEMGANLLRLGRQRGHATGTGGGSTRHPHSAAGRSQRSETPGFAAPAHAGCALSCEPTLSRGCDRTRCPKRGLYIIWIDERPIRLCTLDRAKQVCQQRLHSPGSRDCRNLRFAKDIRVIPYGPRCSRVANGGRIVSSTILSDSVPTRGHCDASIRSGSADVARVRAAEVALMRRKDYVSQPGGEDRGVLPTVDRIRIDRACGSNVTPDSSSPSRLPGRRAGSVGAISGRTRDAGAFR
jgi:hypothetical protein